VQRRVDQAHRDRQAVHRPEDADEVLALQRQQGVQRGLPLGLGRGEDQPLDELPPVAQEHVLGPAQADPLGPEPAGAGGVLRGVGVGAHVELAGPVGVGEQAVYGGDEVVPCSPTSPSK
jgi:hypothetical protein